MEANGISIHAQTKHVQTVLWKGKWLNLEYVCVIGVFCGGQDIEPFLLCCFNVVRINSPYEIMHLLQR